MCERRPLGWEIGFEIKHGEETVCARKTSDGGLKGFGGVGGGFAEGGTAAVGCVFELQYDVANSGVVELLDRHGQLQAPFTDSTRAFEGDVPLVVVEV